MRKTEFIFSIALITFSILMLFFLHGDMTGLAVLDELDNGENMVSVVLIFLFFVVFGIIAYLQSRKK